MCSLEDVRQELETQLGQLKHGVKDIIREELQRARDSPKAPWFANAASQSSQQPAHEPEGARGLPTALSKMQAVGSLTSSAISATAAGASQSRRNSNSSRRSSWSLPDMSHFARLNTLITDDTTPQFMSRHRRGYMAGKELYEQHGGSEDSDEIDASPQQRRQMTLEFNSEGDFGSGVRLSRTISSIGSSSSGGPTFSFRNGSATLKSWTLCVARIVASCVASSAFELTSAFLIVANVIVLGVEADLMAQSSTVISSSVLRLVEGLFCAVFSIEVVLRMLVYRADFFKGYGNLWNMLDLCAVLLQIADILGEEFLLTTATPADDKMQVPSSTNSVRILRVFKLARIIIVLRPFRHLKELRTIIISLVGTMRTLIWTGVLLLVVIYIGAVSLTQIVTFHLATVVDEHERVSLQKHFGSVGRASLVLFQAISNGIDWETMVDPLMLYISPWLAVPVCAYVIFGIFALMNIVTGVFVESAMESGKKEKERFLLHTVRRLFQATDHDHSGDISWKEFKQKLAHPDMRAYFKIIDVDIDEAKDLFKLIDIDESGSIDPEEFVNGCVRLQGPAKAIDLATLMHEYKQGLKREVKWHKAIAEAFTVLLHATALAREALEAQEQAAADPPSSVLDEPSDDQVAHCHEEPLAVPEEGPSSGVAPALAGRPGRAKPVSHCGDGGAL